MLDRTRGVRTALPLARGIFDFKLAAAAPAPAERDGNAAAADDDDVAAARCAPNLAMMREREMRGFRAGSCPPDAAAGRRSGLWGSPLAAIVVVVLAAAASVAAAAVSDVGLTGGGMTCLGNSGVVNILPWAVTGGESAFLPCGLFVIASRTELRGGVLERCATMLLVLDLTTVEVVGATAVVEEELRIFARELAVGACSLDVVAVLLGLKMEALLPLPSAVLSSASEAFGGLVVPLLVEAGATPRCVPRDNVDERETPRTLWRELVDAAGAGFNGFVPVLLDELRARECVAAVGFSALFVVDPERVGAMLFLPAGPSDGREAGRVGFLGGRTGFVSFGSPTLVVLTREAFAGEPAPKFHTLRTIDLAEEKNPKRGVALPLSV